jgi:hypothetical protein
MMPSVLAYAGEEEQEEGKTLCRGKPFNLLFDQVVLGLANRRSTVVGGISKSYAICAEYSSSNRFSDSKLAPGSASYPAVFVFDKERFMEMNPKAIEVKYTPEFMLQNPDIARALVDIHVLRERDSFNSNRPDPLYTISDRYIYETTTSANYSVEEEVVVPGSRMVQFPPGRMDVFLDEMYSDYAELDEIIEDAETDIKETLEKFPTDKVTEVRIFKCWWHENGEQGECELVKTIPNRGK